MNAFFGDAPPSPVTGIPGWETPAEEQALIEYARRVPSPGVIVEIGAEYGRSAAAFASATLDKPTTIVSVDLFPGDLLEHHRTNLRAAGLLSGTWQVVGDSKTVAFPAETNAGVDLLFIDGDHTYEGALADLVRWTPLVKEGGFLLVHDCACATNPTPHYLHFEVTRALYKWFTEIYPGQWESIESVDSMLVFRKTAQERKYKELVDSLGLPASPERHVLLPAIQYDPEQGVVERPATHPDTIWSVIEAKP